MKSSNNSETLCLLFLFAAFISIPYFAMVLDELQPTVTVEAKVLSSSCISSSSSSFVKIGVSSSGRKTYYSTVEVEFPDGTKRYLSSPGEYGGQLKVGDRIKVATRLNSDFLAVDEFNYDLLSKREANCQSE